MTVQRSRRGKRAQISPVVRGAERSRSRICRRVAWERARKTRSSLSIRRIMLQFYNIIAVTARITMAFKFEVYGKIARPVATVFNAVTDPNELSSYFTTGGASAPLVEGATVLWNFADFPGEFPVKV